MSLLNQASFLVTPNGYKASKLYAVIPTNGNGEMTVVRATTATRINSAQVIESVASNVPRIDYASGGCPSILVEPQRTNSLTYSEDFSNASWSKSNVTISPDTVLSPDGNINADTLIENTSLADHALHKGTTITSGQTITVSGYYKRIGRNLQLSCFNSSFNIGIQLKVNLTNGALISTSTVGGGTITSYEIELINNGWYYVALTGKLVTETTARHASYSINSSNSTYYTGDGTSGFYIWGTQLEVGAYATSYIPTTSASATRNIDDIKVSNISTNRLITPEGGTLFVHLINNISMARDATAKSIGIDTSTNGLNTGFSLKNVGAASQRLEIVKIISGTQTNLYTTLTDTVKIAITWNGATANVHVNGVIVRTAEPFTITAMEFLFFSAGDSTRYIKQTALFPTALTQAQCNSLTTL